MKIYDFGSDELAFLDKKLKKFLIHGIIYKRGDLMHFFSRITTWIAKNKNGEIKAEGKDWNKWWMPVIGFFAFLWFMIRVIPKPSRFRYPCQRAAFPLAVGFISWFTAVFGFTFSLKKSLEYFRKARYKVLATFLLLSLISGGIFLAVNSEESATARQEGPIGRAKGINPGRVVWNYNPEATSWDGESNYWWDTKYTDGEVVSEMWSSSLSRLAGTDNPQKAWEKLFHHFNKEKRNLDRDYRSGEKVVIKLNLNTHKSYSDNDNEVDLSPITTEVIVSSLIEKGKVNAGDIVLYDASRPIADKIYNPIKEKYPEITFVDNRGSRGRKKAEVDNNVEIHYPDRNTTDNIPRSVVEAEYLINLASLKKHSLAGITLTAKNHFGSIYNNRSKNWTPSHLHDGINARSREMGSPNPLVSLMGHKELGGKTLLYVIDALYGGMNQQTVRPDRWQMQPFNDDWTSSLFISQDGVAIDSVGFDFLNTETDLLQYSENYLHEAALADKNDTTDYDPEGDGQNLESLGVHEHWNSPGEKLYSGNQDNNTDGIELIKDF